MNLRPAAPADAPALASLGTEAFVAAFGHLYRREDLALFLDEYRTARKYAEDMRDPGTRIVLAEDGGSLLGYSLLVLGKGFDERPPPHPARPAFLSQLYCAPDATGQGVGAALIERAIAEAREWGAEAIQLSVYAENFGAQRFYARYGFEKVADISFWVGNHRDDEFLYELKLQ
jgi:ribosomal protein S18 acetylase RimI-like enzyme